MSNLTKYFVAVSILMLGGVVAVSAQTQGSAITINVATPFVVKDKVLPAGEYSIKRTNSTADSPSLLVLTGEGQSIIFDTMATSSAKEAKDTQVVFENVAGQLYLSKILVKGETVAKEVVRTNAERALIAKEKADKAKAGDATTGF